MFVCKCYKLPAIQSDRVSLHVPTLQVIVVMPPIAVKPASQVNDTDVPLMTAAVDKDPDVGADRAVQSRGNTKTIIYKHFIHILNQ